jgi:hypothetical protein
MGGSLNPLVVPARPACREHAPYAIAVVDAFEP